MKRILLEALYVVFVLLAGRMIAHSKRRYAAMSLILMCVICGVEGFSWAASVTPVIGGKWNHTTKRMPGGSGWKLPVSLSFSSRAESTRISYLDDPYGEQRCIITAKDNGLPESKTNKYQASGKNAERESKYIENNEQGVKAAENYGNLPLFFIKNDGQLDEAVKYYEKGSGHAMFFTKEGVYLSLVSGEKRDAAGRLGEARPDLVEGTERTQQEHPENEIHLKDAKDAKKAEEVGWALPTEVPDNSQLATDNSETRNPKSALSPAGGGEGGGIGEGGEVRMIKLVPLSANKDPEIIAEGLQEGKVNYFVGSDPEQWKNNVPTYSAVVYKEIYPGIDIKFYGNNRQLEYDVIVKPGADPSKVRFAYEGIDDLRVNDNGELEIILADSKYETTDFVVRALSNDHTDSTDKKNPKSEIPEAGWALPAIPGGSKLATEPSKIIRKRPYIYQEIEGKRVEVAGRFEIHDAGCMLQNPPPNPLQRGTETYPPLAMHSTCPPLAGVKGVEKTEERMIIQKKPYIYQIVDGEKREVKGAFRILKTKNTVQDNSIAHYESCIMNPDIAALPHKSPLTKGDKGGCKNSPTPSLQSSVFNLPIADCRL